MTKMSLLRHCYSPPPPPLKAVSTLPPACFALCALNKLLSLLMWITEYLMTSCSAKTPGRFVSQNLFITRRIRKIKIIHLFSLSQAFPPFSLSHYTFCKLNFLHLFRFTLLNLPSSLSYTVKDLGIAVHTAAALHCIVLQSVRRQLLRLGLTGHQIVESVVPHPVLTSVLYDRESW